MQAHSTRATIGGMPSIRASVSGRAGGVALAIALAAAVAGCATPGAEDAIELQVQMLNNSGVTGTVTLTPTSEDRTSVRISVDPAGHPDMPAHIHAGTCEELVPQPMHPLENVVDGESETEILASLDELLADTVALNLHRSNAEMDVYAACVDI